jgi:fibrillarin-like pre-rRNA processing protein
VEIDFILKMSDSKNSLDTEGGDNFHIIEWTGVDGERQLATLNLVEGNSVYGERLVRYNGDEYRIWDPFRSKLAGAMKKGLKDVPVKNAMKVLYLGASTGTTVSHISDIVGTQGIVFAVEPAIRVARELIENVASKRANVVPIIEDARKPQSYFSVFGKVDLVYSDIAQADQTEIAIANCHSYLQKGGEILVVIKTRSIDVTMDPKLVVAHEAKRLQENGFRINQVIKLDPFDKDHSIIHAKYHQN